MRSSDISRLRSQSPFAPASGFALIIALMLMAFLVLLLLSLSALVQTEISVGDSRTPQLKARQNAILGANIALARLQETLGPDQRITAPMALATGTHASKQHWIGVWQTDASAPGYSAQPQLLVSGTPTADSQIGDSDATATLAFIAVDAADDNGGSTPAPDAVRVPLVPVSEGTTENYGYWIYDESLKTPLLKVTTDSQSPWHIASRPGLEQLADFAGHSPLDPAFQDGMARLPNSRSLPLLLGTLADQHLLQVSPYTTFSKGILADAKNGGLRTELALWLNSADAPALDKNPLDLPDDAYPHDFPTWGQLRSFIELQDTVPLDTEYTVRPRSEEEQGIYPILVAVQMGWGIHHSADSVFQITMRPVVVIANPYNAPLAAADYLVQRSFTVPSSNSHTLIFIARNVGTDVGTPQETWVPYQVKTLKFEDIFKEEPEPAGLPAPLADESRESAYIRFLLEDVSFAPGEVKVFTYAETTPAEYSSNGIVLSNSYDRDASYIYGDTVRSYSLQPGEELRIGMKHSSGFSHFALYLRNGSEWERLQKITSSHSKLSHSPTTGDMDVQYNLKPVGEALDIHADLHSLKHSQWQWNSINSGSWSRDRNGIRFLADYNPRADRLIGEGYWQSSNVNANLPAEGSNPLWISEGNDPDVFEINENGSLGYWGPDSTTESFVTLFHLPRSPLLSLGELQHANLTSTALQPAYAFGNALASPYTPADEKDLSYRLNQLLWDGYFFAATRPGSTASFNPRLSLADTDLGDSTIQAHLQDHAQAAAMLMVDGPFNVNNPSTQAWQALLSGLNQSTLQSVDAVTGEMMAIGPTGITLPRLPLPSGPEGTLWRGFRTLTPTELETLAEEIATRVKERGPFLSLADFVNRDLSATQGSERNLKGLLAAAIDASEINKEVDFSGSANNKVDEGIDLPYEAAAVGPRSTHAPGWLSQADILQAIGPLLTVRGDTFVIRSYGDVRDPVTNAIIARALCEMVVQRQPAYIAADKNQPWDRGAALVAPNDTLGRRFTIISFQWLDSSAD